MLFIGDVGIFHIKEQLTWQLTAISAVFESLLVHRTVVHRANLGRHHFLSPECGAFNIYTSCTALVEEFAFITF
jgi:hypothetical protein